MYCVYYVLCLFFLQDGSTPLCEASLSGSMDIVDVLLSAGATVDQEDEVNILHHVDPYIKSTRTNLS